MARNQSSKKLISLVKSVLIDRLIKDEAAIENRSESAIVEKHILDSFLPKNGQARYFAESYLYGDGENHGIGATLDAIFTYNAEGSESRTSKYTNLLPIVQFARTQQSYCNTIPTGKEPDLRHFCSQLRSVYNKFEYLAENAEDSSHKFYYKNEANLVRDLLKEATEEPQFMRYSNFYQIVIDNWDELKNWSITFRMLSDLAKMEKGWRDTPEARTTLLQLLKDVSAEWND
jgi:hypothetical protein